MKKFAAVLICISVLLPLCSCGGAVYTGMASFSECGSVIPSLMTRYFENAGSTVSSPPYTCEANGIAELSDDHGEKTDFYVGYDKERGAYVFSSDKLSFTAGDGVTVNGHTLALPTKQKLDACFNGFVSALCGVTSEADYTTAKDSIRAADADVEVTRITLALDAKRAYEALSAAFGFMENDKDIYGTVCDILGVYALLYGDDKAPSGVYNDVKSALINSFSGSELVWQRYIRDGRTVSEKITSGSSVIRYICAETSKYTELTLAVTLGESEPFEASYLESIGDGSYNYHVQLKRGEQLTVFDGAVDGAYKSGTVKFELRATVNSADVNAFSVKLKYNTVRTAEYSAEGYCVKNGEKTPFQASCKASSSQTVTDPVKPDGSMSLYELLSEYLK